jgi:hypothetical protein
MLLPFFKQSQWSDEREFRILLVDSERYPVKQRESFAGNNIPYIEFAIHTDRAPEPFGYLPLTEIIVGPKVSSQQRAEIAALIDYTEYGDVSVVDSEIQLN